MIMRLVLLCVVAALTGCTTLPNLQSFFGPTPQQRCASQKEDWRAVITYQSDGSGSWRIECVKPQGAVPPAATPDPLGPYMQSISPLTLCTEATWPSSECQ